MIHQKALVLTNLGIYPRDIERTLQGFFDQGWRVVQTCPFQEPVSTNAENGPYRSDVDLLRGNYGILVILEKRVLGQTANLDD